MQSGIETKQEKYFRESCLLHAPTIQVQYNSIRSGNNSTIYNILFACLVRDFKCHIIARHVSKHVSSSHWAGVFCVCLSQIEENVIQL